MKRLSSMIKFHRFSSIPRLKPGSSFINILWVGLTGAVLAIMALTVWHNRDMLLLNLKTARYEYLIWTFIIYTVSIGTVAVGWHFIISDLGGPTSLVTNLKIYVYTLAARRLPGTLWYIAGRVVLYQNLGVPKKISSLASGIEVILSIVSGLIVGIPALLSYFGASTLSIALFVPVELVGLALLHPRSLYWLIARLGHKAEPGSITLPKVLIWLGAYSAMWTSGGVMTYAVISILYQLPLSQIPAIVTLWSLAGAISFVSFLLPNGFGIPEITLSFMLSRIVPLPVAITTAVLIRILTTIFDIIWSFCFLWERNMAVLRQ